MRTVTYAGVRYEITEDNLSAREIKTIMAETWPELERASITEDAQGNISFTVSGGTKGDE